MAVQFEEDVMQNPRPRLFLSFGLCWEQRSQAGPTLRPVIPLNPGPSVAQQVPFAPIPDSLVGPNCGCSALPKAMEEEGCHFPALKLLDGRGPCPGKLASATGYQPIHSSWTHIILVLEQVLTPGPWEQPPEIWLH